jgi:very-short-patch-repair endonuclease
MGSSGQEVVYIIDQCGIIGRREHPALAKAMDRLRAQGRLVSILPGWYAKASDARKVTVRMQAAAAADPDCVILGRAAASVTFWPALRVQSVDVAVRTSRAAQPGYRFVRRRIPAELIIGSTGRLRLSSPSLTALDLVPEVGGEAIDEVLRSRTSNLAALHEALRLTQHRRGNPGRTLALLESRDNAWSAGERRLHAILHAAGLEGWTTNFRVTTADGVYYLDVAFRTARLALEVDGWQWHARHPPDFVAFLRRHTTLETEGWRVLHFGWEDLDQRPDWVVARIRQALAGRI